MLCSRRQGLLIVFSDVDRGFLFVGVSIAGERSGLRLADKEVSYFRWGFFRLIAAEHTR